MRKCLLFTEVCSPINHLSNYLGIFDVQFGTTYMFTKLLMLIPGSGGTAMYS